MIPDSSYRPSPSSPPPPMDEKPTWKDAATVDPMRYVHTQGHRMVPAWRITNRLPAPWPYDPDTCPFEEYPAGHWTRDGQMLMCGGCGIDGT